MSQATKYYLALTLILVFVHHIAKWINLKLPVANFLGAQVTPMGGIMLLSWGFIAAFIGWTIPDIVNSHIIHHPDYLVASDGILTPLHDTPALARAYKLVFAVYAIYLYMRGFVLWAYLTLIGFVIYGLVYLFSK